MLSRFCLFIRVAKSVVNLRKFSSINNIDIGNHSETTINNNNIDTFVPPALSLDTANQKQITKNRIQAAVKKYQIRDGDTGSSAVQIAAMTETILNLARHLAMHKKDKHSKRGFEMLVSKRKRLMAYMKRKDFEGFKYIVHELGLLKEARNIK